MAFRKAVKFDAKLRMAISGPAGAGKTFTALTLATALADGQGIALIDTEHRSASKYADIFEFDSMDLETFHPQRYIDAIHEAEQAGYVVLVIDSLSHAWSGQGGLLEEKDRIAKQKYNNNTFSAWNDASALQNKLVQAILGSKLHIIATVRSKMEYIVEDVNGKKTPRKVGMAPVQRDDLPYEFDVFSTMETDNTLLIDKSRCPALSGAVIPKPDGKVAEVLKAWLRGEGPAPIPQSHHNGQEKPVLAQQVLTSPPATNTVNTALQRAVDAAKQRAINAGVIASDVEFSGLLDSLGIVEVANGEHIKAVNLKISEMVAAKNGK